MDNATWRKSTYTYSGGNCVETGALAGRVLVRDTTDRPGPALAFTPETWRRFAAEVKAG